MRVIFTCGGTAGHINPAVALAGLMRQRMPETEVLFVGARGGMEEALVAKEGYDFRAVDISSFYRSLSLESLRHNLKTAYNLLRSPAQARAIIEEFKPDLVVGTGGYASFPVVNCAAKLGIPTAVHESNAVPGLTTKALARVVDRVMVGFESCRQYYPHPDKVVVTGTPVRGDFYRMSKSEARAELGIDDGRKLIVSFWGSLGAAHMNEVILSFFEREIADGRFRHIHSAGRNYEQVGRQLRQRGVEPASYPELDLRPYIYDMPQVMRAADLVICRAGASTISELTALGVPAIMVPSPYVTNNHQEKNARILSDAGAAVLLREEECTGENMYAEACRILDDEQLQQSMGEEMAKLSVFDAAERIYDLLISLCK